jgi:hypothetical protein
MVLALVLTVAAWGGRTALAATTSAGAVTRSPPQVRPLPEESSAVAGHGREARACPAARARRFGSTRIAYAAQAVRPLVAYARPGRRPLARFGLLNVNRFPTIFGVLGEVDGAGCRPLWYRVQLPMRPNGTVGYVRARLVRLVAVSTRIHVDLSSRRLDVFSAGLRIHRVSAAIGAPRTPTPIGRYYVNQLLRAADPSGPWGPGGLGISAFSPVLVDWPQGGPIGIHGTNLPAPIGRAASNGCLRVDNRTVEWLFRHVPAGTPVVITP